MRQLIFIFILMILGVGCASGPKFASETNSLNSKARLYIYRNSSFYGVAQQPFVIIDGKKDFELKSGGYAVREIPGGDHKVELTQLGEVFLSIQFKAKPNEVYYLRYTIASINYSNYWTEGYAENKKGVIEKYSDHAFKQPQGILWDHVQSKFDPRLFFVAPEFAIPEISKTFQSR